jgi:hypothetical protein
MEKVFSIKGWNFRSSLSTHSSSSAIQFLKSKVNSEGKKGHNEVITGIWYIKFFNYYIIKMFAGREQGPEDEAYLSLA